MKYGDNGSSLDVSDFPVRDGRSLLTSPSLRISCSGRIIINGKLIIIFVDTAPHHTMTASRKVDL